MQWSPWSVYFQHWYSIIDLHWFSSNPTGNNYRSISNIWSPLTSFDGLTCHILRIVYKFNGSDLNIPVPLKSIERMWNLIPWSIGQRGLTVVFWCHCWHYCCSLVFWEPRCSQLLSLIWMPINNNLEPQLHHGKYHMKAWLFQLVSEITFIILVWLGLVIKTCHF